MVLLATALFCAGSGVLLGFFVGFSRGIEVTLEDVFGPPLEFDEP